jgi:hypothetical protein
MGPGRVAQVVEHLLSKHEAKGMAVEIFLSRMEFFFGQFIFSSNIPFRRKLMKQLLVTYSD